MAYQCRTSLAITFAGKKAALKFLAKICCYHSQARLLTRRFPRLFWGEQPPFTSIGRGGRYFFGGEKSKRPTSKDFASRRLKAELRKTSRAGGSTSNSAEGRGTHLLAGCSNACRLHNCRGCRRYFSTVGELAGAHGPPKHSGARTIRQGFACRLYRHRAFTATDHNQQSRLFGTNIADE